MLAAARENRVSLMVGTMKRYDPAYEHLLGLLPLQDLRLVSVTTLESPFQPYVQAYPLTEPTPPPSDVVAALRGDDDARLARALPEGDDETRYCYRWMLLDNLVHELNMLRGALGEPTAVLQSRLSRTVCDISLAFGQTEVHISWVDLLFELEASIREKRPPRTDVIDGLHDVALCHAIARSQITNGPVSLPSRLPEWSVQN